MANVGDVIERTVKVHSINQIRDGTNDKGNYWRMSQVQLSAKKEDGTWVQIEQRCKTFQNPPLDTEMKAELTVGEYKDQREFDVDFGPGHRSFDAKPGSTEATSALSSNQEKKLDEMQKTIDDIYTIVDRLQSQTDSVVRIATDLATKLNEVATQQAHLVAGRPPAQQSMSDSFDAPPPAAPAPTPAPAGPTPPPTPAPAPPGGTTGADHEIPF